MKNRTKWLAWLLTALAAVSLSAVALACKPKVEPEPAPKVVTTISVEGQKTVYELNESIDRSQGSLNVTFSDSTQELVALSDKSVAITDFSTGIAGTHTVRVRYEGVSALYEITVNAAALQTVALYREPDVKEYEVGAALSLAGGLLELTYSDTTKQYIGLTSAGVDVSGYDSAAVGSKTVTVTYGGKTVTFSVTVKPTVAVHLAVKTAPTKTDYKFGETAVDLAGGVVTVTYGNGTTEDVTLPDTRVAISKTIDYTGVTGTRESIQTVKLTVGNVSAGFDVTVAALRVALIRDANPTKVVYALGNALDLTGGSFSAVYDDFNNTAIADVFNVQPSEIANLPVSPLTPVISGFDTDIPGIKTVRVTYGADYAEFTVLVEGVIASIVPNVTGLLAEYPQGQGFSNANDLTGTVTVNYVGGFSWEFDIQDAPTVTYDHNPSEVLTGRRPVTVTYTSPASGAVATGSFTILITPPSIAGISLAPDTFTIDFGAYLPLTTKINLVYTNGNTGYVFLGNGEVSVSYFDNTPVIDTSYTVTVEYRGFTTDITVHVVNKVASIAVINDGSGKTDYDINEGFDPTGYEIVVTFTDTSIPDAYVELSEADGFALDFSTAGNKNVTVSYRGRTATVAVTVLTDRITATTLSVPDTLTYAVGGTLNLAGGSVNNGWASGKTDVIALTDASVTLTPVDLSVAGTTVVTVTYGGNAVGTFTVTVLEPANFAVISALEAWLAKLPQATPWYDGLQWYPGQRTLFTAQGKADAIAALAWLEGLTAEQVNIVKAHDT
ncbi:MAG: bacterial Ig-like domain-containing protein, partial [Clostridiales bacterium]|nr:bacterial Ig-like domain-containing protein [Clostridiales bacterium]